MISMKKGPAVSPMGIRKSTSLKSRYTHAPTAIEHGSVHFLKNLMSPMTRFFNAAKVTILFDCCTFIFHDKRAYVEVFGGSVLQTAGGDFSFQLFQTGTETGFLHTYKNHSE